MNKLAKRTAGVFGRIGFFSAYGSIRSRLCECQAVIISYHRIDSAAHYPWSITPVSPDVFDLEMRYLREKCHVLSLDELAYSLENSSELPKNAAVITIDDGYKDIYLHAYPFLKKYGLPATVFLATGSIDTATPFWPDRVGYALWNTGLDMLDLDEMGVWRLPSGGERSTSIGNILARLKLFPRQKRDELIERLVARAGVEIPSTLGRELVLSWDEIREMSRGGISFGAHTVNHPILSRETLETARKEILDSKRRIEHETGHEVSTFCYPNGESGDYNADIERILKTNGFNCAVTLVPSGFVSAETPLFRLLRVTGASDFATFKALTSGFYLDLAAVLGRARSNDT